MGLVLGLGLLVLGLGRGLVALWRVAVSLSLLLLLLDLHLHNARHHAQVLVQPPLQQQVSLRLSGGYDGHGLRAWCRHEKEVGTRK
jgi:hypothetical protein